MAMKRPVLAVDWDGTVVEQRWPEEGDWLPGAREALWFLSQKYDIYIWSSRLSPRSIDNWDVEIPQSERDKQYAYVRGMLDAANLGHIKIAPNDIGKIGAQAYIDDKAIRFTSWADAVARVALHCE